MQRWEGGALLCALFKTPSGYLIHKVMVESSIMLNCLFNHDLLNKHN